jgi:predicted HAD superfamily Cof-like phosphohydrolase
MTNFEKVKEFNRVFKTIYNDNPTLIDVNSKNLKYKLIAEESREVKEAMDSEDMHEIAKELCDLLYVAYGAADAYGIPIDKCFDEVHRSNMSKLDKDGNPIFRTDGKILKSELYSPADLKKVF